MPALTTAFRALRAATSALAGPGPGGSVGAWAELGGTDHVGGQVSALSSRGVRGKVDGGGGAHGKAPGLPRRWSSVSAGSAAGVTKGVGLSESAVRRLREVNARRPQGDPEVFLRVTVDSGGCGGFQYAFSLDTTLMEGEECFEHNGARVAVDQLTLEYMEGSTVDYEDTLMRAGFAVASNPKASSKCGCGTSFTPVEL